MKNKIITLACNLSSAELQKHKETIIADFKNKIIKREETQNGVLFKFNLSDEILDLINEFIKTEKECCPFFIFNLNIKSEEKIILLELTGEKNVKDFIYSEFEM